MIIYASPKSGKSTFCKDNPEWIDSDIILFKMLDKAFKTVIVDDDTKGQQIIKCFKSNRIKAENVYTDLMYRIKKMNDESKNILLGTRRFMWLADIIFLKDTNHEIYKAEIESAYKWKLPFIQLKQNDFITIKLINSLILTIK